MDRRDVPDYYKLFEALPGAYLILSTDYTFVAASDLYLQMTNTVRENIIGKKLAEVFPNDPHDPTAHGVKDMYDSFNKVMATKKPDVMDTLKYNIPKPGSDAFELRYWSPQNYPFFDEHGDIIFIINYVEDVTGKSEAARKLAVKTEEIEKINKFMIDRELKMKELKKEIEMLKKAKAE